MFAGRSEMKATGQLTYITMHGRLIARLEKATGPDRELDGLIFRAIDEQPGDRWQQFAVGEGGADVWYRECRDEKGAYISPSFYTASIDAALALVPDGLDWDVSWVGGVYSGCVGFDATADIDVRGATPAIALCIAALKARAALQTPDHQR